MGSLANKHHSYAIDYIRAISAILIVLYHYTYRYNENAYIIATDSTVNWPIQIDWGYGGVATFFILSGYLLARNLNCENKVWKNGGGKLLIHRLLRLYPTYWVCMTITAVIILFIFPEARVSFKEYFINLTMMASTFGVKFVDGAYWTLGYEVKFVIILSAILLIHKLQWREILCFAWIGVAIASSFWSSSDMLIHKFVRVFLITDWVQSFIAGICVYQITKEKRHAGEYYLLWCLCMINQLLWIRSITSLLFFTITSMLLYFQPYLDKLIKTNFLTDIMEFIASISYPLYLLHQMIGFAIIKYCVTNDWINELIIFIPFSLVLILSFYIHRYIEIPSSKWVFKSYPKIKV